jgi:hypothetical protein
MTSHTHYAAHTLTCTQIDMVKLASLTGYTPGSASVTFGNIKRKIKQLGDGLAADGPATPKKGARSKATPTPKSTGKRTASATDANEDESPSKRPKKSTAKKIRDDDDDDEHFVPRVKKEEVDELNAAAMGFYGPLTAAAGYIESQKEQNF